MVDERFPPSFGTIRLRRRGPRSLHALVRRSRPPYQKFQRQPPNGSLGESGLVSSAPNSKITLLYLNIRGFVSHQVELEAFLRIQGLPTIVGITETLLEKSTKTIALSQYVLISRLDRRTGISKGGGIALFVLEAFAARVVHIGDSETMNDHGTYYILI